MISFLAAAATTLMGQTTGSAAVAPLPARAVPTMTLSEATDLALAQASNFKGAQINEGIAAEDIKQARAAFYPKIAAVPNVIYTTPSIASAGLGVPRLPSFLGANAITEYQLLTNTSGEIDVSGKLKANLIKSQYLLASARAGTAIARLELISAVEDSYFSLALASTKKAAADANLAAANEFEANIRLQLTAGEVAPVDLVRARLQTAARRDELAQAVADEKIAAGSLQFLTGGKPGDPIRAVDLLTQMPLAGEIDRISEAAVAARPEFAQLDADAEAAKQEIRGTVAERRPQVNYSVSTGVLSDSLGAAGIKNGFGAQVSVGLNFTIFDKGARRARETQARLRLDQIANSRRLAERALAQMFFTARTQANAAAGRIRQLGDSVTDAEQNLTASLARYRAGEASIIEVTDAQNLLIAQKQSLYQAIYDYQTARAHLLKAIGQ